MAAPTVVPCATDVDSLLAAAWAAANTFAAALDENARHSMAGLTAQLALGQLPAPQAARVTAYWAWWQAVWAHYRAVKARINAGAVVYFDPSVPGACPYDIWALSSPS
jgi:hypothetical protein